MFKYVIAVIAAYIANLPAYIYAALWYVITSLGFKLASVSVATVVMDQALNYLLGLLSSVEPAQLGQLLNALGIDHFFALIFAGIAWRMSNFQMKKPSILIA